MNNAATALVRIVAHDVQARAAGCYRAVAEQITDFARFFNKHPVCSGILGASLVPLLPSTQLGEAVLDAMIGTVLVRGEFVQSMLGSGPLARAAGEVAGVIAALETTSLVMAGLLAIGTASGYAMAKLREEI